MFSYMFSLLEIQYVTSKYNVIKHLNKSSLEIAIYFSKILLFKSSKNKNKKKRIL